MATAVRSQGSLSSDGGSHRTTGVDLPAFIERIPDFFLNAAKPQQDTLLVLDYESHPNGDVVDMNLQQARDFVGRIYERMGKYPGIYGGGDLKKQLRAANIQKDPVLSKCWLWLAQYASTTQLPSGWDHYTFWQYTDGINGPGPILVPGILGDSQGHLDRSIFNGSRTELVTFFKTHAC